MEKKTYLNSLIPSTLTGFSLKEAEELREGFSLREKGSWI